MAPRASWKGFLKIADVTVPVGLYSAASTSECIALHTINRPTGHRVRREFVDAETGDTVERDDQVKGYELGKDDYVILEPEELAAAVPESDKSLAVSAFIDEDEIDDVYFDRPYFLGPSDRSAGEALEDTLAFLFPDQPVHCFLSRREPAKFALGEGLQRLVEDFG